MKAIVVEESFGLENIKIQELSKPTIKDNEVLIKVEAGSLNYLDLLVVKGKFGKQNFDFPHIIGTNIAGRVVEVGTHAENINVGDLVCNHYYQTWQSGVFKEGNNDARPGTYLKGVFSEYIALPAYACVPIPSNLSTTEAAALPIAGLTAWEALVTEGKLIAGQTILIKGTGGVSVFALQFAKMLGAKAIVTSSADEKLEKATALGANVTLNYKTNSNWKQDVLAETAGQGVDLVLEVTGAELNESLDYLALNGKIIVSGFLSGTKANLDILTFMERKATIFSTKVGSKASFIDMNRAIEINNIKPFIGKIFPLDKFKEAFDHLEYGKHFGKVIITF
ncbi:zinc-dependent alcohol dehydrogenase family protein [Olivibacter sitiensis]|uniref:zinc-dependent alcohol dehydrogenase family protein n=1 Tax=Olivibacter sitiensis TaxID=376470 RepID=UPI0004172B87|nr:NAD(P)-dependent alcohol dehydrogenase [Olivibacter sitiensis]